MNMNAIDFFAKALNKSLKDNAQLIFAKKITISIYSNDDVYTEIVDINEIIPINEYQSGILCLFDNRTQFALNLAKVDKCKLSIYFPLTREKFIISANSFMINGIDCKEEKMFNINKEEILNKKWEKLTTEEKLQYETVDKDSIKKETIDDLNKYIAQEKVEVSKNFSIGVFVAMKYEYTVFPMPQVIANTRKMKFESLLKPHKMPNKFLMEYKEEEKEWKSVQLN